MISGVSKFVYDCFDTFSHGYSDAAEVIVSSMLSKLGLYDIQKVPASSATMRQYSQIVYQLQESYIWSDLYEVSDVLRCSFLYKTTYDALLNVVWMNDTPFQSKVLELKKELVDFIREHSIFLAYCDMEQSSVFLYSNGSQAISKETFMELHHHAMQQLSALEKKYKHQLPRMIISIINVFVTIIDVREIWNESLITKPSLDALPRLPKVFHTFCQSAMVLIPLSTLFTLHTQLELIYTQLTPFHVLSTLKWFITMQGSRNHEVEPIMTYVGQERYEIATTFINIMSGFKEPCLRGELIKLPFLTHVAKIITDDDFFNEYSLAYLGEISICILGNAIKLYLRSVQALVLSDLLFAGFYDVLAEEHHPDTQHIANLIQRLKTDLEQFKVVVTSITMARICTHVTKTLQTCLKKLERYHKRLLSVRSVSDDNDIDTQYLTMIFGDVDDHDGKPLVCAVCLDNSQEKKDAWWRLPCKHQFHMECISRMVTTKHTTCPLCRHAM